MARARCSASWPRRRPNESVSHPDPQARQRQARRDVQDPVVAGSHHGVRHQARPHDAQRSDDRRAHGPEDGPSGEDQPSDVEAGQGTEVVRDPTGTSEGLERPGHDGVGVARPFDPGRRARGRARRRAAGASRRAAAAGRSAGQPWGQSPRISSTVRSGFSRRLGSATRRRRTSAVRAK